MHFRFLNVTNEVITHKTNFSYRQLEVVKYNKIKSANPTAEKGRLSFNCPFGASVCWSEFNFYSSLHIPERPTV